MKNDRRKFIKQSALAGMGLGLSPWVSAFPYRSPNDKVRVAVMGIRSRGGHLAKLFAQQPNTEVGILCDVDSRYLETALAEVSPLQDKPPKTEKDIRRVVEDPDIDAVVIAAPDHWHAPAALLALAAGKHVYVEKPCSHNPREGELLVEAQKKHGLVVQMGNQRRSFPNVQSAISQLHAGRIGEVYMAKAWYTNRREPIGHGKELEVPDYLDWDLFQGPAPRTAYRDNVHPYNWHWFRRWGTGEALNNGTHTVDLARWGLNESLPSQVVASGGRYHYDDDWEFPDTMNLSCTFDSGKILTWEGRSCQPYKIYGTGVGNMFHGTEGTCLIEGNSFVFYDMDGNEIASSSDANVSEADATNPVSPFGGLDGNHIGNFLSAIRTGTALASPIEDGQKSVLLCQLANISWLAGRTLNIDTVSGHILNDKEAMRHWSRDYEPGWVPEV